MNKGFWENLAKEGKGIFCLAPMADVTDAAFRRLIAKYGKSDVMWTEFVSADGLMHPAGREKLMVDLMYTEAERPIVAQIFGSNVENMRGAAKFIAELGFDGVDINMGCPDKTIEKQGAGAAHIKDANHAREIIRAVKQGVEDAGKNIPVSVKTRVGYNKVTLDEWIPEILSEDIAVLTVHARTRKEMSLVPARWEHVKEAVAIRDKMGKETLIIGNGDVKDLEDGRKKIKQTGCDGVMLGRAIFGNPWLFSNLHANALPDNGAQNSSSLRHENFLLKIFSVRRRRDSRALSKEKFYTPSLREKLGVMVEHTKLFEEILGGSKNFAIMKKHYKAYVNNFDGAKELRVKLMESAETASDVERIVEEFLAKI